MKKTTLCYLEKDGCFLMMLRNKKKNDENSGKWIGLGGKLEAGESADMCVKREIYEEAGVELTEYRFLGTIRFNQLVTGDGDVAKELSEEMFLYTATGWKGEINMDCPEGTLRWIPKDEIMGLSLWEGDRLFLSRMLAGNTVINMDLFYTDDKLTEYRIN